MSEDTLVRQAAPTLAGIKTGSLFPCPYETREALLEDIRAINRRLAKKGLCLLPLKAQDGRALLYLYRPESLRRDLRNEEAARLLRESGYAADSAGRCVGELARRLREGQDFPHEIGLFLSYPPEDVRGFIDNRAQHFKCCGMWKVYGDEKQAEKTFARYRKCTELYCGRWREGWSLEQLAVVS